MHHRNLFELNFCNEEIGYKGRKLVLSLGWFHVIVPPMSSIGPHVVLDTGSCLSISIGQEVIRVTTSGFMVQFKIGLLHNMVIVLLEHRYLQLVQRKTCESRNRCCLCKAPQNNRTLYSSLFAAANWKSDWHLRHVTSLQLCIKRQEKKNSSLLTSLKGSLMSSCSIALSCIKNIHPYDTHQIQIIHVCCKAEDQKKKGWREENKQWRRHWCHFQNCCCYSQGGGWAESRMKKRKRKENRRERERERWNLQNAKAIKNLQSQPPSKGPQGTSLYIRMTEPSNKRNSGILTSLCMQWSLTHIIWEHSHIHICCYIL